MEPSQPTEFQNARCHLHRTDQCTRTNCNRSACACRLPKTEEKMGGHRSRRDQVAAKTNASKPSVSEDGVGPSGSGIVGETGPGSRPVGRSAFKGKANNR